MQRGGTIRRWNEQRAVSPILDGAAALRAGRIRGLVREGRRRVACGQPFWMLLAALLCVDGCGAPVDRAPAPATVAQSIRVNRAKPAVRATFAPSKHDSAVVLATVAGQPVMRSDVDDLLYGEHGVNLLEQLVALHAVREAARDKGMKVSGAEIEVEYIRSLDALLGQEAAGDSRALRTRAAESLLDEMLASRNSVRGEYMIVIERNALLRKLVQDEVQLDKAAVRLQFERMYGERVQIRHIQTSSREDFDKVLAERTVGVEFGDLAVRFSANRASADNLGLLPPFPREDPDIPEAIRREAFLSPPGIDSNPIFVDGWFHLIRVERRIPGENVEFENVRADVESVLREKVIQEKMREAYADIIRRLKVNVHDATMAELYYNRHPDQKPEER